MMYSIYYIGKLKSIIGEWVFQGLITRRASVG